jgi:hypothetical protein
VDLFEVVGWVGAVLVLVAYWLVTKFGTSPLRVNALHHGAFPSTTVNLVWAAIAVWGLAVTTRRRARD